MPPGKDSANRQIRNMCVRYGGVRIHSKLVRIFKTLLNDNKERVAIIRNQHFKSSRCLSWLSLINRIIYSLIFMLLII